MAVRSDLRNIAIVAHVDHGKTTLVDALLWQSGAFRANQDVNERVMDSMDLEREKGITILAKNTAVRYGDIKLNIIDTPGHADFGGEVERGLTMVDGVLLLVDASEGPLPQTRFVLRKALEARLPVILVINKVDRPDARIGEVVDEVYELFLDLDADESQIDFPIVYTQRQGRLGVARPGPGGRRTSSRCSTCWSSTCRRRATTRTIPAGARHQPRRLARTSGGSRICRVHHGRSGGARPSPGAGPTARSRGSGERAVRHRGARAGGGRGGGAWRDRVRRRHPRDHDRRDARRPRGSAATAGDQRRRAVAVGDDRHQRLPLAGQDGDKLTASQLKARLERELIGNVSMRVAPTERPEVWEVQGRGELALAMLVELMRREGFEMTVGKPQVVTREIDGSRTSPSSG